MGLSGRLNSVENSVTQSWTWIGSIHGLDWIGSDDCNPMFFFINIFSLLTNDKRCRCNTIMCILADFNRL